MSALSEIARYLTQQQKMYGGTLYADPFVGTLVPITIGDSVADEMQPEAVEHAESIEPSVVGSTTEYVSGVADLRAPKYTKAPSLEILNATICECVECALGATRTNFVFGSGNPNADIMVIGEAPGADEDEQGLPFVGRAGQLLTKILEAVHFAREEVYICNILKCRPPNNRKPLSSETDTCEPYLHKQIELIKPKYILALGLTAANTLLKNKLSMTALRATPHMYQGIPTIVTYHPAALLRNPEWKKHTWEDVQLLRKLYDATR